MTDNNEQTTEFPEDTRLFNIGIWAGIFGWLILIIGLIRTGLNFAQYISMGNLIFSGMTPLNMAGFILSNIQPLLSSIGLWFVLKVVKELLFIIIDIKEFIHDKAVE